MGLCAIKNSGDPVKECQNIEWKETWSDEYLKWICGFANAQGGKLYIGIDDSNRVVGVANAQRLLADIPNKIVTTLGIVAEVNLLSKDRRDYIEIVVSPSNIPIAYRGSYHYRSGSTKQELKGAALQQFLFRKMGLSWDDVVQERATLGSISPEAIDYFQRNAIRNNRMAESAYTTDIRTVLENLNLLDENGHLKNTALLVFGRNPAKYFPLCDFRIGRFGASESDLMFQDVISGDLIRMADRVVEVLKSKYLISPIHYEGLLRIEPLEIPEDALREAISNAIIHKDYTGVHIQMKVYNDRVELWDEGTLPAGWTIEDLLREHNSKPRNRNIAEIFYRAGFIESWGRGIDKIISGIEGSGLPRPKFEYDCGGIRVTFFRNICLQKGCTANKNGQLSSQGILSEVSDQVCDQVSDQVGRVLNLCKNAATLAQIGKVLTMSSRIYIKRKYVNPLLESGLLEMTIPDKPTSSQQKYRTTAKGLQLLETCGGKLSAGEK